MKCSGEKLFLLIVSMFVFFIGISHAAWQVVDDCSPDVALTDVLNTDTCSFRLKFTDKHDDARVIVPYSEEMFFNVNTIKRNVILESGEVTSISFYADIPFSYLRGMYYSGAIAQSSYDTLSEIYRNPIYRPLSLTMTLIRDLRGEPYYLMLECFFLEEGSATERTFTTTVFPEYFVLEAQCVEKTVIPKTASVRR